MGWKEEGRRYARAVMWRSVRGGSRRAMRAWWGSGIHLGEAEWDR